jgi:hypothetical protein
MTVISLISSSVEDLEAEYEDDSMSEEIFILREIAMLPIPILSYIQQRVPTFTLRHSKTTNTKYYANTCPSCNVITGDFHLHNKPGSPFFPNDKDDAERLYIIEIPLDAPIEIDSGYHIGTGDLILKYAKSIN